MKRQEHLHLYFSKELKRITIEEGFEKFITIKKIKNKSEDTINYYPKMWFDRVIERYGYPVVSKKVSRTIWKLRKQNLSETYRNYLLYGDKRGRLETLSRKWRYLLDADFQISGYCCDVMKERPMILFQKQMGFYPMIGTMAIESQQRKLSYLQRGCNTFVGSNPKI